MLIVKWELVIPPDYRKQQFYGIDADKTWKNGQAKPLAGVYKCIGTFVHKGSTIYAIEPVELPKND